MNDILNLLNFINPAELTYSDWTKVGMCIKAEGYPVSVWDEWSRDDNRYHKGECKDKWATFNGTGVTGGTLYQMAVERGFSPSSEESGHEFCWDDEIQTDGIIDAHYIETEEIKIPDDNWNPVKDLVTYLETLFDPDDNVGYVTESYVKNNDDGTIKYIPSKGHYDRTSGQLIEELNKCKGDIGSVLGDYDTKAGAWIRFNPLDGKGVKNENVSEFRYALVESDSIEVEKQKAIIQDMELPVATMVFSGKKSIHAIVRIDAKDYNEYRKRVDYLYSICEKSGLKIDTQNRNPSRLSRMPGVIRNQSKQFLITTNIGKKSFLEWQDYVESINDNLPDPEGLNEVWNNMPDLAPALIENVLRKGHKMLLCGSSKAGKSFLLIELCIAIAEGQKWLQWQCAKGKVLYVNLELDRASCLHRFKDVYTSMGLTPNNLSNIDIWNLRGKSVPMDKLAPKLIRRAIKKNYIAVIIDPIYKVITGDENSADQMANFCNQFDKICTELNTSVIYCHHHSKGEQGSKKSMDRASGSGVFARDPDALMDMLELKITDAMRKQLENNELAKVVYDYANQKSSEWKDEVSQDDMCSGNKLLAIASNVLIKKNYDELIEKTELIKKRVKNMTAWRIDGTLREFAKFEPLNMFFDYPVHMVDENDYLKNAKDDSTIVNTVSKDTGQIQKDNWDEKRIKLDNAINLLDEGKGVTINDLQKYYADADGYEPSKQMFYKWLKKFGYWIDKNKGVIVRNIKKGEMTYDTFFHADEDTDNN